MAGAASHDVFHLVGFSVGGEEFCVDILKVQEIIRMVNITRMPNAPDYVEGIINIRGRVIPVIDLRKRFRLKEISDRDEARRIVVVDISGVTIGLMVDEVSQVWKLSEDQISPAPETVKGPGSECISGVGMLQDRLVVLLDLEKLLTEAELHGVAQAA